ncbi:XRE family transcriptional regulator [Rhizobium ruizarguesonis]|nr:XRE family transcriptional regulator [Rhizobium ruizarguesonis]
MPRSMTLTMDIDYFVAWRKRQGLTQEQLAEKMWVSLPTVKKWERKARKLPPYIGFLMACVEQGIEPVGKDAMLQVDDK